MTSKRHPPPKILRAEVKVPLSENEETFAIHIGRFDIFDMKAALCEVQLASNEENSIGPM